MKKLTYILISILLWNCKSEKKEIFQEYNGQLVKVEFDDSRADSTFTGYGGEHYPNGNLKSLSYIKNGIIADTLFYYYENGKIKEKGLVKDNMVYGWWSYNDENGKLTKKIEWFHLRDSTYKNQEIHFDSNGKIKIPASTFFELQIPDTIQIGKNMARINNYVSNVNDLDTRYLSVIIENYYPDSGKKTDTFPTLTDNSNDIFFGIYGDKIGKKIIEGKIEEKTLKTDTINSDSLSLTISDRYRYFKKEVYVSDNGKKSELSKKLRAKFKEATQNN
ncbi:hypothetical protein GCM10022260_27040 [Gaetbulibacter aestuarii]|uniref:toxin-antitoxin system YwqK family antitoxin n=1 Tax=Gaetbulibacter aestuarii TaxID=1502358 RepID=UPI0031DF2B46